MMAYAQNVTVIIPTLNRSHFVVEVLKAMKEMGFGGRLLIGDSSNDEHFNRTRDDIAELGLGASVVQRAYPGMKAFECIRELVPLIETPYAMWMPDDDILVPQGLEECARFLDDNDDYGAAGGVAVALDLDQHDYHRVARSRRYRVNPVEDDTAAQRLLELLADYTVLAHALSRADLFLARFQLAGDQTLSDEALGNELFPVCLMAVQGKVKMLDRLFVVRQIHGQRYILKDHFERVTSAKWQSSFQTVRDCLTREISRIDRIDLDEADALIKQAFWGYLADGLSRQYKRRYGRNGAAAGTPPGDESESVHRLRLVARSIPGARMLWSSVRSMLSIGGQATLDSPDPYSLDGLLDPSSPYHADFWPIYRCITTTDDETVRRPVNTK